MFKATSPVWKMSLNTYILNSGKNIFEHLIVHLNFDLKYKIEFVYTGNGNIKGYDLKVEKLHQIMKMK